MHHLFVSRAGDSLVNVTQNRNTYRLLANFDGTNVILLQIDAGSVVWLTPDPERPVYLEYYTLLTGELTLHTDEGEAQTLCAGDSFYTTGLDHDISITPKTDVRLLCFTSKPVFDDFMGFVNDLNDLNTQIDRKDHYTYHHSRRVMRFAGPSASACTCPRRRRTRCCSPRCITTSANATSRRRSCPSRGG